MTQKKIRHQLPKKFEAEGSLEPRNSRLALGAGEERRGTGGDPEGLFLSFLKDLALDERARGVRAVTMTGLQPDKLSLGHALHRHCHPANQPLG